MFGRYALPQDDEAQFATSVTGSAEDPEYPAEHINVHASPRPAKLTTQDGYFDFQFASAKTFTAIHIVYDNFDDGLDVTLEPNAGSPGTPITIPVVSPWENGWRPNRFLIFPAQTASLWRLAINSTNGQDIEIFKVLLYEEMRDLGNDVRWGVVEDEEQGDVRLTTDGGRDNIAEIWGPRRSFTGEFALRDNTSSELISLHRSAKQRIRAWTLQPDQDVDDAWWVRFEEPRWQRTRETIDHNIFPFRVREVSRGLPWP